MMGIIVFGLVINLLADSRDYEARVNRMKARGDEINRKIEGLGLALDGGTFRGSISEDKPEPSSLFSVHDRLSPIRLPHGKEIHAELLTRLVVGGDQSPVILSVLPDQGFLSGLRITGKGNQGGTFGRVNLAFSRLLLRSGRDIPIQGIGLDHTGALGLEAEVISGKLLAIGGSIASSFISGLAAGSQTQTTSPLGFTQVQPTGRNALLQGVAQTAADQSKRLVEESTKEKPVLVIERGQPVTVFLEEEVRI